MQDIRRLRDVVERYDLFLIDQFGVLHDGAKPYPAAAAALESLRGAGKAVGIISNSGKRARVNEARMARMGFARSLYDHLVTSGEVAWETLSREFGSTPGASPSRCFLVTSEGDHCPTEGLDLEVVTDSAEADIVLIAGTESDRYPREHYRALLAPAAARGTPCLCSNPDKIALLEGRRCFGAGAIAEMYEDLGGPVRWLGKPFPEIYRFLLGCFDTAKASRTLCIGDSIEHDVAGARAAGLDSLLVHGGILADQDRSSLGALGSRHGAHPDYLIPTLAP